MEASKVLDHEFCLLSRLVACPVWEEIKNGPFLFTKLRGLLSAAKGAIYRMSLEPKPAHYYDDINIVYLFRFFFQMSRKKSQEKNWYKI